MTLPTTVHSAQTSPAPLVLGANRGRPGPRCRGHDGASRLPIPADAALARQPARAWNLYVAARALSPASPPAAVLRVVQIKAGPGRKPPNECGTRPAPKHRVLPAKLHKPLCQLICHRIFCAGKSSAALCQHISIVPGHPVRGFGSELPGVPLQFGQVLKGVHSTQFTGMDQTHKQIADLCPV